MKRIIIFLCFVVSVSVLEPSAQGGKIGTFLWGGTYYRDASAYLDGPEQIAISAANGSVTIPWAQAPAQIKKALEEDRQALLARASRGSGTSPLTAAGAGLSAQEVDYLLNNPLPTPTPPSPTLVDAARAGDAKALVAADYRWVKGRVSYVYEGAVVVTFADEEGVPISVWVKGAGGYVDGDKFEGWVRPNGLAYRHLQSLVRAYDWDEVSRAAQAAAK
jgi:hypothetical protein